MRACIIPSLIAHVCSLLELFIRFVLMLNKEILSGKFPDENATEGLIFNCWYVKEWNKLHCLWLIHRI